MVLALFKCTTNSVYKKGRTMRGVRKFLAAVFIFLIASGFSARTAFASSAEHDVQRAAKVKLQLDSFAPGAVITVKLKDHRKIEGKLVARLETGFELAAPKSVIIRYTEVKGVAGDPGDQATSGNNQYTPRHHSHLLRNGLIAFGVYFVFALVAAVASK